MALAGLLGNGVSKALTTTGSKALAKTAEKATTTALSRAISGAGSSALGKALTGAGKSTLLPYAGSTLDGILGKSSGLTLPNASLPTFERATTFKNLPAMVDEFGDDFATSLATTGDDVISRGSANRLAEEVRGLKNSMNVLENGSLAGNKLGDLPKIKTSDYTKATGLSGKDIPKEMRPYLSEKNGRSLMDNAWSETFPKYSGEDGIFNGGADDILGEYNAILGNRQARGISADDLNTYLNASPERAKELEQEITDNLLGKKDIKISGGSAPAKKIKVGRTSTMAGVDALDEPAKAKLVDTVAEMKAKLQTATGGGGQVPPNGPTTTATPDYGGLGDSGFKVEPVKPGKNLNTGQDVNVVVSEGGGVGATKPQQAVRRIRDRAIKELNATPKQYEQLMGKSRSYSGHYGTVADRIHAENITQANIADKTEAMMSHIEAIKNDAFAMADELGLKVDLAGVDNMTGMRPGQKRLLTELGMDLNEMIPSAELSASQAEDVYRILKSTAYDLMTDENNKVYNQAGKALNEAAEEVSKRINGVLDNMGVDYKASFLDGAGLGGVGADGKYLQEISKSKTPFKFSDLRREESDWINIGKLSGRPLKEEKVPESITEFVSDKIKKGYGKYKEFVDEKTAGYGGRASGGSGGSPTGSPTGAGGTGTINIETVGNTSGLGNLLGKAKSAGLVGAGVLGGLLLGGGGGSTEGYGSMVEDTGSGANSELASLLAQAYGNAEAVDNNPYNTMTLGGYTLSDMEDAYMNAMAANDAPAMKSILAMMEMLENKIDRELAYRKTLPEESTTAGGIAEKQQSAINVLNSIMENFKAKGPISGRVGGFLNMLTGGGFDPNQYAYDTGAAGSLGTIIKALGEAGALSEGDQKRALALMPSSSDSESAARLKYQQLLQTLRRAGGGE